MTTPDDLPEVRASRAAMRRRNAAFSSMWNPEDAEALAAGGGEELNRRLRLERLHREHQARQRKGQQ